MSAQCTMFNDCLQALLIMFSYCARKKNQSRKIDDDDPIIKQVFLYSSSFFDYALM